MVYVEDLFQTLKKNKINFFTGVPDSVLKKFTNYIDSVNQRNIIAVNEGAAIANAIGYNLLTDKIPCVYMQNSGIGNALNPILSIADSKIYNNNILLVIGHRGFNGKDDEPQHLLTGKITQKILLLAKIKYIKLDKKNDLKKLEKLIIGFKKKNGLVCCLVKNNSLELKKKIFSKKNRRGVSIPSFLDDLIEKVDLKKNLLISSTGYPSRELLLAEKRNKVNLKSIYNVGGMGHTSSISFGVAQNTKKNVICIDGDGSMLMHLGNFHTIGLSKIKNFKNIILNNNMHGSVGGQKTEFDKINTKTLFKSLNFNEYYEISKNRDTTNVLKKFLNSNKSSILKVNCSSFNSNNLPRVKNFKKIKKNFKNS